MHRFELRPKRFYAEGRLKFVPNEDMRTVTTKYIL